MSHKKILVIGTTDNKGGAASVGWNIGEGLRGRGYSVKYIVGYKFSNSPDVHQLRQPLITNFLEKYLPYNFTGLYRHLVSGIFGSDIDRGAYQEILSNPWYKEADIVHLHNLHGSYFNLNVLPIISSEKKVIWTLHDMWAITGNCVYSDRRQVWVKGESSDRRIMEYPPMFWNNSKRLWEKKKSLYKSSPNLEIVTPSMWLQEKVKESILGDKKIHLIYNGIDTMIFQPKEKISIRKKLGLPIHKKIITFIAQGGSRDPRKGWVFIQELANRYINNHDILFLCIGGNSIVTVDNIRYLPNIKDKKILSEYYASSDIFLFTSLAENCPLVVLEAMATGVPIVSFAVGGVPELVTHKINGYIAKYKDQQDLEKGLSWILNKNDQELTIIKEKNVKKVKEKYSLKVMTDQYAQLIEKL